MTLSEYGHERPESLIKWLLSIVCNRLRACNPQIHQAWNLRNETFVTCTAQIYQAWSLRGGTLVTLNEQVTGSNLGRNIDWPERTFSRYTPATPSKYWDSILNYTMTAISLTTHYLLLPDHSMLNNLTHWQRRLKKLNKKYIHWHVSSLQSITVNKLYLQAEIQRPPKRHAVWQNIRSQV
jgi:hypothetical protein